MMVDKYTIINDRRSGSQYMILDYSELQDAYWCCDVSFDDEGNAIMESEHWVSAYDINRCIREGG